MHIAAEICIGSALGMLRAMRCDMSFMTALLVIDYTTKVMFG